MEEEHGARLTTLPSVLKRELRGFTKENGFLLVLEGEPAGKAGRGSHGGGRCYTPRSTREAEQRVARVGHQQYGQALLMSGRLAVELLAISPIPKSWSQKKQADASAGRVRPARKPDFDHLMKLYCDGLNGVFWADDKQIVDGRCIKVCGERPAVQVWVWPSGAGTC